MKFRYKKYGPKSIRPVIPIEVVFQNKKILYEVLVDSGADICLFHSDIADILGIDIKKGEEKTVAGITGFPEKYYLHKVTINVGGWQYKTEVGFLLNFGSYSYGIVGQNGFFDIFIVKFDLLKEEVELKERV